jgi:nicotinate-nucleotide adenylyltransferase
MVEIAISKEPGFEVSQAEFNRPDISYTVETLRALKKEYPKTQFFLIIGDDTLAEIPRWREPEEIRRLAQILAAPREGGRIQTPSEKGITRIEMPVCPFSSSEIREKISQGKPVTEMLPPGVENYIRKMKLYPKSPSKA